MLLLKKTAYLTHLLMFISTARIQECLNVYLGFENLCKTERENYGNNWSRILEFDSIATEVMSVFLLNLTINMI